MRTILPIFVAFLLGLLFLISSFLVPMTRWGDVFSLAAFTCMAFTFKLLGDAKLNSQEEEPNG